MARIRTIKPEFFTSEDICELSPHARLFYIALWCEADREGRFAWKAKTFKLRYFPADDIDIEDIGKELTDRGLIEMYGDGLAHIPKFLSHQHINNREAASSLPDPHASPRVKHASPHVKVAQGGREGKEGIEHASDDTMFNEFWSVYPKRVSKGDALKAYKKLNPTPDLHARILAAVKKASALPDWQKDNGQFIPYPASWLNARRWEDEQTGVNITTSSRFAGLK